MELEMPRNLTGHTPEMPPLWWCVSKRGAAWVVVAALQLLLAIPPASPAKSVQVRPKNLACDSFPHPFGTSDTALPGFVVLCGPNREAMLPIGDTSYEIHDISLEEGYATILAGPIHQVCYSSDGAPTTNTTGSRNMDLRYSQFSFSKRNRLTVIGCNKRLHADFLNTDNRGYWPGDCLTACQNLSDIFNGFCANEVCCQTQLYVNGSQEFTSSFKPTTLRVSSDEYSTCSAAFLLDESEPVFLQRPQRPLRDELKVRPGDRLMALDWSLKGSCKDRAPQYQCPNGSVCLSAPSGVGFICKCSAGYAGNAYIEDGCADIDECRDFESNNCVEGAICKNRPGSYTCSCPPNKTGDGYKTATGCDYSTLSGSPIQTPLQDNNSCAHLQNNPCIYSDHCTNELGSVSCTCPLGNSGDGRKKGSGCKKDLPIDITLVSVGVGLALVVTITTTAVCFYWSMRRRDEARKRAEMFRKNGGLLLQQRFSAFNSQGMCPPAKIFSSAELNTATNNYSDSRIIGRGGHGTVYKGILPDNSVVAIKKSTVLDESQAEQFVNEITIVSQMEHPNVVKLLGCCLETQVPSLVYEFIPNGTLFQHIHNRSMVRTLTWEDGIRIAAETAEAIAYLHCVPSAPIIHRDIKSSNILLDENYVAKISDFGASRSVPFDQTHITTLVQGTIGYLDPEYFQNSQLTEKSDVYSFGVVLAELLTEQKPVSLGRPENLRNLAMYLVMLVNEGRLLHVVRPHILAEAGEEQLYAVAHLSVRFLNLKGEERPAMKEVASILSGLRRSFVKEKSIRRRDESIQDTNEEAYLLRQGRPPSSIHSSEGSRQYSMEAEMLASSRLPR